MTRARPRAALALAASATGLLLCGGLAAEPVAATMTNGGERSSTLFARAGKVTTEFRFTFDRRESLRAGTKVRDVSGHRNHGTVKTSNGGHLRKATGTPERQRSFRASAVGVR